MTHLQFCHPAVRVGVIAQRPQVSIAEKAVAAGDCKGYDHAIAYLHVLNCAAQLNNLAHEFMTENVSRFHCRDVTIVKMQIGAANRR